MKQRLLTPGPSPVPEETLLELAKPVGHHRTPEARQVLADVLTGLQQVFCTTNDIVPLTCSGTGGMEAALSNVVPHGGKALILSAGRFGDRWANIAEAFGILPVTYSVESGETITPETLAIALQSHPDAAAVCTTLCETSTGSKQDVAAFGQMIAETDAVFLVDGISGVGAVECRTDEWNIDILVVGSQKALMLPPGLAFVAISDKAWGRIESNSPPSFYLDLKKARSKLAGHDTPFTPAHTLLRAARVSLQRIQAAGIENEWARHAKMAEAARAGVQAIGLELLPMNPAEALTAVNIPSSIDGLKFLKILESKFGIKLAGGQDDLKGKIFRLAHMGYIDQFDVLTGLAAIELALLQFGYELTPGTSLAAAQQVFAR